MAETDLIQLLNIDGLEPVKASVNTTPFGSVDGSSYVGSSVISRNIVLTLRPNPNWDDWTYESLRRLIYSYFMPKRSTKLEFYSDDIPPVGISGIVEGVDVNVFSEDPQLLVSIICPDPYFISLDPMVVTGQTIREGDAPIQIEYEGTIETGVYVQVTDAANTQPDFIWVQIGDPTISYFKVDCTINSDLYFEMSSVDMQKYAQTVDLTTGVITNLLNKVHVVEGSAWPTILKPGTNDFSVITDAGTQDWTLKYYERFGGL
jgi:Phage tail protein